VSHSRSGAGRTAQPFLSQPEGGSGGSGATCRHPGTLRLQTQGPYPHSISRGLVVRAAAAFGLPLPALDAFAVAALAGCRWPTPSDPVMRVSHETIYLSLFSQSRGALRRERQRSLRTGRAMRYPRAKRLPLGRGQLRDTLHISQRPAEAANRAVPGHWEGDLVFGRRPSAVGTLVERHSRYVVLFPLPNGFTAERLPPELTTTILRLPQQLRRSLTWDQGWEMVEHVQFTVDSGVQVYFCDPRSP
jgi:hypothetical protein